MGMRYYNAPSAVAAAVSMPPRSPCTLPRSGRFTDGRKAVVLFMHLLSYRYRPGGKEDERPPIVRLPYQVRVIDLDGTEPFPRCGLRTGSTETW